MSADSIPWDELDPDIAPAVRHLADHGIEPFSSCQGGDHNNGMPYVMFRGDEHAGLYAVWLLESYGFHVWELSRVWMMNPGYPLEPHWQVTMRTLTPFPPLDDGLLADLSGGVS